MPGPRRRRARPRCCSSDPPQHGASSTARVRDPDPWERLADWLAIAVWRPAAVAALPLVLGFIAGLQAPPETDAALMRALSELPLATSFEEPTNDA